MRCRLLRWRTPAGIQPARLRGSRWRPCTHGGRIFVSDLSPEPAKAPAFDAIELLRDPKHLGARIGITAVLHTWGSAMTHHPRIHMIVPGGGLSLDGRR